MTQLNFKDHQWGVPLELIEQIVFLFKPCMKCCEKAACVIYKETLDLLSGPDEREFKSFIKCGCKK